MSSKKAGIGIVGCGNISGLYFQAGQVFDILDIRACADIDPRRAEAKAAEYGVKACTVAELLADPTIDIVVNLTVPKAHGEIGLAALEAGKSIYNEKPLALTREEARRMLELAAAKGLRVGGAPDTFLGAGLQTCRRLIDDGAIGEPVGATAFMLSHGPEQFHPDPEFFYEPGGGPMFDMGPYYLTALVNLLGPVRQVTGMARASFPERTVATGAKAGKKIKVQIPTHIVGVLEFASGAVGNLITSFDAWACSLPCIEIYGSEGTLSVPDPNTFGGPVRLFRADTKEWRNMELVPGYPQQSRGLGIADMAHAIRSGRNHRANGELTYHVLDLMHAFHDAARASKHVELSSTCQRPMPLPTDLPTGILDD
ncbi:MAG: Gfo/Idh/MocA family oxidoreductase [Armatimonadetes bacterium]|nr:Gfo/Idh/MocA family oxidoreductase [Armatimonadota bacterium]